MIHVENLSDKLVKLTSDQPNGMVMEILTGRKHKEVICSPSSQNNFTEYIPDN